MTIYEIPLDQSDGQDFRFQTELFGVRYFITFRWNPRDLSWAFDMDDANGSPIVEGMRAILSFDLLAQVKDYRKPPGFLMLIDTSEQWKPPGADDLGTRVKLTYNDLLE